MILNIADLPAVDHKDGEMYGTPIADECRMPSEFIEPYVQRFLMMCMEELAYFNTPVSEVKARLNGVRYFVTCYSGIHARIATDNIIFKTLRIPDDELKAMAMKIFRDKETLNEN